MSRKIITNSQKKEIKNFMAQTPYYACYNNLARFLEQKYPKPKVSELLAWAINNNLDQLCTDQNIYDAFE